MFRWDDLEQLGRRDLYRDGSDDDLSFRWFKQLLLQTAQADSLCDWLVLDIRTVSR